MLIRYPPYDYTQEVGYRRPVTDIGGEVRLDHPTDQISGVHTGTILSKYGHAEFSLSARGGQGHIVRRVGLYFRPPYPEGLLTVTTAPSYSYYDYSSGAFQSTSTYGAIFCFIYRRNLSRKKPPPPETAIYPDAGDSRYLFDRRIDWWIGSEEHSDRGAASLTARIRTDNSHWYLIWIGCAGNTQAGSDQKSSSNVRGIAKASISMDIPWIDVQFSRPPLPGHRTLPGYRTR